MTVRCLRGAPRLPGRAATERPLGAGPVRPSGSRPEAALRIPAAGSRERALGVLTEHRHRNGTGPKATTPLGSIGTGWFGGMRWPPT